MSKLQKLYDLLENEPSSSIVRRGKKVHPNDKCPCGSGRKAKNCCGTNAKYDYKYKHN